MDSEQPGNIDVTTSNSNMENSMLIPKIIRKIARLFRTRDRGFLRLISKTWNEEVGPLLGPIPPLCFTDVASIDYFVDAMGNTKDYAGEFEEVIIGVSPIEPIVDELFDLFGSNFRRVAIVEPNWKLPFLQKLLEQIPNAELLSLLLNASHFDGLSLEFPADKIPALPSLVGLCIDTACGEGCLKNLTRDLMRMTPLLENLALNFNTVNVPVFADLFSGIKNRLTKLFIGWDLSEDDTHALLKVNWEIEHIRLGLRDDERFSSLALHAVLDHFKYSLRRLTNFMLSDKSQFLPGTRTYRITTLPSSMQLLTVLELQNVVVDPGVLAKLACLITVHLRPNAWENVLETLTIPPGSPALPSVRTLRIEGLESISTSAPALIERIREAFPNLKSLTIPACDPVLLSICLLLTDIQELVLDGVVTDEGVTGFTTAVCCRLREGLGDTGDSQDMQLIQDATRRLGNITDLTQLRRISLRNEATDNEQIGLTDVGMQYGFLQCPSLVYIEI